MLRLLSQRRKTLLAIIIAVFALIGFGVLRTQRPSTSLSTAQTKRTITVKKESVSPVLGFKGSVKAKISETLTSSEAGTLERITKHYGELVKPDEAIITLKSPELNQHLTQHALEYLKAKHQLKKVQQKYQDNHTLFQEGIISRNEYEQTQDEYQQESIKLLSLSKQLGNTIEKANIALEDIDALALDNLKDVEFLFNQDIAVPIVSKHSGILLSAANASDDSKNPGLSSLSPGKPVQKDQPIAVIASPEHLLVEILATESDIHTITPNAQVSILDNLQSKQPLTATIASINPYQSVKKSDGGLGFPITIEVECPNTNCPIHIGSDVHVQIKLPEEHAVHLPFEAVSSGTQPHVLLFNKTQNTWHKKPITVLKTTAKHVIVSGLDIGETIAAYYQDA